VFQTSPSVRGDDDEIAFCTFASLQISPLGAPVVQSTDRHCRQPARLARAKKEPIFAKNGGAPLTIASEIIGRIEDRALTLVFNSTNKENKH
jgi:hypothetical protein